MTDNPELILSITVADCLPVYFFDQKNKVVGIAHAGWRGVENGIVKEVIGMLKDDYRSSASDISVFVGPHIGACHFAVGNEVADKFFAWPDCIISREGKSYIDLAGVVRKQLASVGVLGEKINISPECTYCLPEKFFSYRRDNPGLDKLEVMTAYIGLK